jgi:hypothetical protein
LDDIARGADGIVSTHRPSMEHAAFDGQSDCDLQVNGTGGGDGSSAHAGALPTIAVLTMLTIKTIRIAPPLYRPSMENRYYGKPKYRDFRFWR